jgi:cell division transport system permease protein
MKSIAFFLREALRSLSRNAVPSFAALASVLVTVLVLGVFIPIVQATTGAANDVRHRVLVNLYLKPDAKPADVDRVRSLLASGQVAHVGKVEYVSKAAALREQRKKYPEAYDLLGSNPLPDTFRITPTNPDDALRLRDALSPVTPGGGRTTLDPAIDVVKTSRDETQKILVVTRVVKIATAVLVGLLVLASVLLISNTIRLSLFSRRREVEVMKLVGATDWFIRWPFVIEGILLGALGGAVAILLLLVGKIALLDPLISEFALLASPQTIQFGLLAAVLLGAAIAVSAVGSGISLRRFLRV